MSRFLFLACLLCGVSAIPAHADFRSWSVEKEDDPFSGGDSVAVSFTSSLRSGVIVTCNSAEAGLKVRAIPGFVFDERLQGFKPTVKFAFDGKLLFTAEGETGAVGDNLAASETKLTGDQAQQFVEAFAAAKKQIAIDDGISDKPHLLNARGSTTSGAAIVACIKKQSATQ